jgi:hypothetical protein
MRALINYNEYINETKIPDEAEVFPSRKEKDAISCTRTAGIESSIVSIPRDV